MSIKVVHGANTGDFPLEGKTVAYAERCLRDVFNIPAVACAMVNGTDVDRQHVLEHGDALEFTKIWGCKGGVPDYWSEAEVCALFGPDAVVEMREMGCQPTPLIVFTKEQVASWQAKRVGRPVPSKNGLVVDPDTFSASYRGQDAVELGNTILFQLFSRLARRPGTFVAFNVLKIEVWNDELTEDTTVGRTIRRLREKVNVLDGVCIEPQKHTVRLMLK